jgi:predicted nucleic acid binding AN1-type Zn finger protein
MKWQKIWESIKNIFLLPEPKQKRKKARKQDKEIVTDVIIKPEAKEEPKREIPANCETCNKKFEGYTDIFCCKYCGKYSCTKHFLPEKHNCPNPDSPFATWGKKFAKKR